MSSKFEFDRDLLDLQLGQLPDERATALRSRIGADPRLAEQSAALAGLLRVLDQFEVAPPTTDLAARACAGVATASRPPRVLKPVRRSSEEVDHALGWIVRVRNVRDIIAVAAMIVLAIGVGVPSLLNVRERYYRIGCSANLARVGQGLQAYASIFNDSLPFAGWSRASSWQPTKQPGVELVPNRRHVYPLVRVGHALPDWLICPARRDVPMPREQVGQCDDFIDSRNLSYAYQNMAGVRPSLHENPDLPVLADDNPLFDNGLPLLRVMARQVGLSDPAGINSRAHKGEGQNILTLSGYVKWMTTPNCGVNGDNIWMLNDVSEYKGTEGPKSPNDSHLIK